MVKKIPEKLSREIRKFEIRLEDYLKEEEVFVKELRKCLAKFKELNKSLEGLKTKSSTMKVKEWKDQRMETIKTLSEALKKESVAEHERSHLLESYGTLLLALEEELNKVETGL